MRFPKKTFVLGGSLLGLAYSMSKATEKKSESQDSGDEITYQNMSLDTIKSKFWQEPCITYIKQRLAQ